MKVPTAYVHVCAALESLSLSGNKPYFSELQAWKRLMQFKQNWSTDPLRLLTLPEQISSNPRDGHWNKPHLISWHPTRLLYAFCQAAYQKHLCIHLYIYNLSGPCQFVHCTGNTMHCVLYCIVQYMCIEVDSNGHYKTVLNLLSN